jgi:heme-degrading monooxygenase HmoA
MIARTWRGAVRAADAERYARYIQATGLAEYSATPGNRGAYLLYRIDGDRAEVLTVSLWDSLDAVRGFAGEDVERAVFYPEDDAYLVERDLTARHWSAIGRGNATEA